MKRLICRAVVRACSRQQNGGGVLAPRYRIRGIARAATTGRKAGAHINVFPRRATDTLSRSSAISWQSSRPAIHRRNKSGSGAMSAPTPLARLQPDGLTIGLVHHRSQSIAPTPTPAPFDVDRTSPPSHDVVRSQHRWCGHLPPDVPELTARGKQSRKYPRLVRLGHEARISAARSISSSRLNLLHVPYRAARPHQDLLAARST